MVVLPEPADEQQIRQLEQEIASLLQRDQDAVERLAVVPGLGGGFGATDYRRSGCQGSDLSLSRKALLVGRGVPGKGRERGCEPQPGTRQRATARCAAFSIKLRMLLSNAREVSCYVSGAALDDGTRSRRCNRRNCALPLSLDLDNSP